MACSKYARKRRERGDCMADATGVYRGRLRSGRGTRARVYVRAAPRNGLEGAEGAGKKADSGEPKLRECETGLGHGERASAGTNRRNHTPDGVGMNREREGSERAPRAREETETRIVRWGQAENARMRNRRWDI